MAPGNDDGLAVARKCIQCGTVFYADLSSAATGMCAPCAEAAGLRRPTDPLGPMAADSELESSVGGGRPARHGAAADPDLEVLRRGVEDRAREEGRSALRRKLTVYAIGALILLLAINAVIGRCGGSDAPADPAESVDAPAADR